MKPNNIDQDATIKSEVDEVAPTSPAADAHRRPETQENEEEEEESCAAAKAFPIAIIVISLVLIIVPLSIKFSPDDKTMSEYYNMLQKECFACVQSGVDFCKEHGCYNPACIADCYHGRKEPKDWAENCDVDSEDYKRCFDQGACLDCHYVESYYSSIKAEELKYDEDCGEVCRQSFYSPAEDTYESFDWCYPEVSCSTGRPFRQQLEDAPILANAVTSESDNNPWSEQLPLNFVPPQHHDEVEKEKWVQRALGEHASVASFASFTIALMTHRAPPHLIKQTLEAAQDEVRHACLAFAQASASSVNDTFFGPADLPPTNLQFSYNLTALALSVAQEGCLEESLSAYALAVEATLVDTKEERALLFSIAMDEGRHAGLAWRTLHWICQLEDGLDACDAAKAQILRPDRVHQFVRAAMKESSDVDTDAKDHDPPLDERGLPIYSNTEIIMGTFEFLSRNLAHPSSFFCGYTGMACDGPDKSYNLVGCISRVIERDRCRDTNLAAE